MNPHQLIGLVGPANNFAMGGVPMHLAQILLMEGKPLPPTSFPRHDGQKNSNTG